MTLSPFESAWISKFNEEGVVDATSPLWGNPLRVNIEIPGLGAGILEFAGPAGVRISGDPYDAAVSHWRIAERAFARWAGIPTATLWQKGAIARDAVIRDPDAHLHKYVWEHLDVLDASRGAFPNWPAFTAPSLTGVSS